MFSFISVYSFICLGTGSSFSSVRLISCRLYSRAFPSLSQAVLRASCLKGVRSLHKKERYGQWQIIVLVDYIDSLLTQDHMIVYSTFIVFLKFTYTLPCFLSLHPSTVTCHLWLGLLSSQWNSSKLFHFMCRWSLRLRHQKEKCKLNLFGSRIFNDWGKRRSGDHKEMGDRSFEDNGEGRKKSIHLSGASLDLVNWRITTRWRPSKSNQSPLSALSPSTFYLCSITVGNNVGENYQ